MKVGGGGGQPLVGAFVAGAIRLELGVSGADAIDSQGSALGEAVEGELRPLVDGWDHDITMLLLVLRRLLLDVFVILLLERSSGVGSLRLHSFFFLIESEWDGG